jgi:hypothetical protein
MRTQTQRKRKMGTKENTKLEQLREQALASIEGDDPFRKEKVTQILAARTSYELKRHIFEVLA